MRAGGVGRDGGESGMSWAEWGEWGRVRRDGEEMGGWGELGRGEPMAMKDHVPI